VQPRDFIPVAEESDLILEIGQHVLQEACREAVRWDCAARGLRMSVNVSARQLVAGDFAADVMRVLHSTGLEPPTLCIEMTEGALIEAGSAFESLQALRDIGVHLAVDDFGSGYSSLTYLRHFPVDVVKIDRVLVERLASSTRDRSIVAGIAALGRSMGMDIIVEGVERPDQVATLTELGCEFGQGFVFGRAEAAEIVLNPENARR
jgi:EAL domain-containing protein (putative c-di-GMP-specific phosphodiesterase class I)